MRENLKTKGWTREDARDQEIWRVTLGYAQQTHASTVQVLEMSIRHRGVRGEYCRVHI